MGIFDFLGDIFGGGEGYKQAGQEYQKYANQAQGYLNPYNMQGQEQYSKLMEMMKALQDPAALQGKWAESYKQSPEATQAMAQAKDIGENEASSMGLQGSSAALNNIQKGAADIGSKDRQNYLNDMMQKYMTAIGVGQNIYGMGGQAAQGMSNNQMDLANAMARAKYGEKSAGMSNLFGIGGLLGSIFGGRGR